ncbi:hypothetical protein H5410_003002 [Solanum commersonii]|uniref:Uncharacterized protein n=1 Tax=Solanum commersonii TaxID=4109 RepID=A0A9J6B3F7_SOLCO|nr:hypothetical protein H5410_003002 [Solanum commersonii]
MEPQIEEENSNIDQVIQVLDGTIDLKFIRSQSCSQVSSKYELRHSKSIKSTSPTARKIQGVKDSLHMMRLDEPFEPDIKYLNKLWTSPENSIKNNGKLNNHNESLNMLGNKWYTTNNKVVESTILLLEEIKLPIEGKVITASPFKMDITDSKGDPTNKDINNILQQNNYTNQLLYVISNQILRADNKSDIKDKPSSSYKDKNKDLETHPIFKLPKLPKDKFPNFQEKV